jgi:hypothetical protein
MENDRSEGGPDRSSGEVLATNDLAAEQKVALVGEAREIYGLKVALEAIESVRPDLEG